MRVQKNKLEKITKSARKVLRPKYPQQCQPNQEANRLIYRQNKKTYTNRSSRIRTNNKVRKSAFEPYTYNKKKKKLRDKSLIPSNINNLK